MNKKAVYSVLIIILLAAFLFRLIGISNESYWLDEALSIRLSQQPIKDSIALISDGVQQPLHTIILWIWVKAFGITELSTRFLSLIFGVLSVYIIYLLGKELFDKKIGLYAAAILAFSRIAVYYSQETRAYSLLMFLTLASFYSYLRLEKDKKHYVIYILSTTAVLYTHAFSVIIPVIQNIHKLYIRKWNIKEWIIIQAIILILFLPGILTLTEQTLTIDDYKPTLWREKPGIIDFYNTSYELSGHFLLRYVFFASIIYAGFILVKTKNKKLFLLLTWSFLPFITVIIYGYLFYSLYLTRYFLFTLPAFIIVLAWGISQVPKRYRNTILIAILILLSIGLTKQYLVNEKDDWRSVSDFLKTKVREGDIVFVHPFYQQEALAYYYNPQCFDKVDLYSCNALKNIISIDPGADCCNINSLTTYIGGNNSIYQHSNKRIWFVDVRSEILDKKELFEDFQTIMNITEVKDFGNGFIIYRFE